MNPIKSPPERFSASEAGSSTIGSVQRRFSSFRLQRSSTTTPYDEEATEETRLGLHELYSPPDPPAADFIFVHGLRGGSIKTWRKHKDSAYYWPKAWIPHDADLAKIRTSSFGYQSDWLTRKDSILKVHDFGRKLLNDLQTSSYLRRTRNTPIVFVGHSMGGLVIKKAYLLAHRESPDLATRIRSMVFLATPHRGSDSADLLHDILELTGSQKSFVDDLLRSSPSLQQINDDFRFVADEIDLWSFIEERKMRVGLKPEFVVGRDSATLGYKNEKIFSLDANHREICKFEHPEDANYRVLRNCLVTILDKLYDGEDGSAQAAQLDDVQVFLNANHLSEVDLEDLMSLKTNRTCEWIERKSEFRKWINVGDNWNESPIAEQSSKLPTIKTPMPDPKHCQIYWLGAPPGAGKSVCSAHVITTLKARGYQCSYFFFQDGVRSKQTLTAMLRSLALQMARLHPSVREFVKSVQQNGIDIDKDSEDAVWRHVFVPGVLKAPIDRVQIWILDGLDECIDGAKLAELLRKMRCSFPLRIFVASRPQPDLARGFHRLSSIMPVYQDSIQREDTDADMQLYLASEDAILDIDDDEERSQLEQKLLAKSNGCFLWVKLVRSDLEGIYLEESFDSVLDEIPDGMTALYERSLASIAKATREKKLAREKQLTQTLLRWAVCARRPLTLAELEVALKLDSNMQVRELRRSIDACGNLLYVDRNDCVQLIHSTLREFLFDPDLESDFAVRRQSAHESLAQVCLRYMEQTMRPPRSRSFGRSLTDRTKERPMFEEYAATSFSEHIASASSTSDALLLSISRWLKSSVLSWIEYVASVQPNLYCLTRTARNFKRYLERRAKHVPPLGVEFKLMHDWSTDLIRLVAKFGRNLKDQPSSIFFLIPSIAPRHSMLYTISQTQPKWLELTGSANVAWDDCVSFIEYRETYATALASGHNAIAIGMKNGAVILYDQSTCQEKLTVRHRLPELLKQRLSPTVRLLTFDSVDQCFASAGLQSICVWSVTGELLHLFEIQQPLVNMFFTLDQQAILAVTRSTKIVRITVREKEDEDARPSFLERRRSSGYVGSKDLKLPNQAPLAVTISSDQTVLALLYRGKPIYLYNVEDDQVLGTCGRDSGSSRSNISVLTAVFNPSPGSGLLAVSHQDGDLALYDSWTLQELASVYGDAYSLAASPDGQTLASGNTGGTVRLWDFETLGLLYVIRSGLEEVRSLAFTGEGSRLVDRRDTRIKVWEPSALIRRSTEEDVSQSEAVTPAVPEVGENDETVTTTAMCSDRRGEYVFAGRSDGSIVAFDVEHGDFPCATIYQARDDTFAAIMRCSGDVLAVVNSAQMIQVWKTPHSLTGLEKSMPTLKKSYSEPIRQLLLRDSGTQLLVVMSTIVEMLTISHEPETTIVAATVITIDRPNCWATIAQRPAVLESNQSIALYDWASGHRTHALQLLYDDGNQVNNSTTDCIWQSQSGRLIAAVSAPSYRSHSTTDLLSCANPLASETGVRPAAADSVSTHASTHSIWNVRFFLGMYQEQLVYLDHDLWICSLQLDRMGEDRVAVVKHIFIPPELVSAPGAARPFITQRGHLVFNKEDKLAIIKGAMDWSFG